MISPDLLRAPQILMYKIIALERTVARLERRIKELERKAK